MIIEYRLPINDPNIVILDKEVTIKTQLFNHLHFFISLSKNGKFVGFIPAKNTIIGSHVFTLPFILHSRSDYQRYRKYVCHEGAGGVVRTLGGLPGIIRTLNTNCEMLRYSLIPYGKEVWGRLSNDENYRYFPFFLHMPSPEKMTVMNLVQQIGVEDAFNMMTHKRCPYHFTIANAYTFKGAVLKHDNEEDFEYYYVS